MSAKILIRKKIVITIMSLFVIAVVLLITEAIVLSQKKLQWKSGAITATLSKDGTTLTISGRGAFRGDFIPWFEFRSKFTTIIIKKGISQIESNAYNWPETLESITLPHGLTSIGDSAFYFSET